MNRRETLTLQIILKGHTTSVNLQSRFEIGVRLFWRINRQWRKIVSTIFASVLLLSGVAILTNPSAHRDVNWHRLHSNPIGMETMRFTSWTPTGKINAGLTRQCCQSDEQPTWSPSGQDRLLSSPNGMRNKEIYVMDADGKNQRRLTNNEKSDASPAFGRLTGKKCRVLLPSRWEQSTSTSMDADGKNQRRLISQWRDATRSGMVS